MAISLTLLVITAALAIDIGRLSVAGRQTRNVVDIAALDAVQLLDPNGGADDQRAAIEAEVRASAARNGFVEGRDGTLETTLGVFDPATRVFTASVGAEPVDAVRVRANRPNDNLLVPGSFTVTRSATATRGGPASALAGIGIATTTAAVDTARSAVLNAILGNALGDSSIGLDLLSWQALAASSISLLDLATVGFDLSPDQIDELLTRTWSTAEVIDALVRVVGTTPNGLIPPELLRRGPDPLHLELGRFIEADMTSPGAHNLEIGIADLLQAVAMASATGNTVPVSLNLAVPELSALDVSILLVDPPRYAYGPTGTTARSSQIQVVVDSTLSAGLPGFLGLPTLAEVDLPLVIEVGSGKATIDRISCDGESLPTAVLVDAETTTAGIHLARSNGSGGFLDADLVSLLGAVILSTKPVDLGAATSANLLTFPPYGWDESQPLSFATSPADVLTMGDLVPVILGNELDLALVGVLVGPLNSALTALVPPLLRALGVDLGIADISVPTATCQSAQPARLVQ